MIKPQFTVHIIRCYHKCVTIVGRCTQNFQAGMYRTVMNRNTCVKDIL